MLFEHQIIQNKRRTVFILIVFSLFVITTSCFVASLLSLSLTMAFALFSDSIKTNQLFFWITFIVFSLSFISLNFFKTYSVYKEPLHKKMRDFGAYPLLPDEKKKLYPIIEGLALAGGIETPLLFIIRTNKINAFALSTKNNENGIAITSGLVEFLSKNELEGVLAHELAHILNKDSYINQLLLIVNFLYTLFGTFFLKLSLNTFRNSNYTSNSKTKGGIGIAGLVFGIAGVVFYCIGKPFSLFFRMATSRQREYLADATAVKLTRNPLGILNALRKLNGQETLGYVEVVKESSSMFFLEPLKKHWFYLFTTHPSLEKRIARLEKSK